LHRAVDAHVRSSVTMTAVSGRLRLLLALLFLLAPPAWSGADDTAAASAGPVLEVFVREGCPHCAEAKHFLAALADERPALRIVYHRVDADPAAREALFRLSREAGIATPGVPTFRVGDRLMVGFDDAEHSGPDVRALLEPAGGAPPADAVETAWFGTLSATRLGLPLFTLALGLLDGFNPCATWVLLFLLSLLVRLRDRRRIALVAGTFVVASGAVYYAFMAAWLNVFLAVGMSDALRWTLAAIAFAIGAVNVKDFVAWGQGPSLAIPASARPGLYTRMRAVLAAESLPASLAGVAVLAVVVNFIELLCTAGLPAIYTAVLTAQHLDASAYYAYLGLYIVGYLADDTLMVGAAVIALGSNRLSERAGRWLKLVSGLVMLALAVTMIFRPDWLM
jgi:glutaredoxin